MGKYAGGIKDVSMRWWGGVIKKKVSLFVITGLDGRVFCKNNNSDVKVVYIFYFFECYPLAKKKSEGS